MESKDQQICSEIKKIRNKEVLFEIFKIIYDNNTNYFENINDRIINEDDNSIYLSFNKYSLVDETYNKINDVIEKYKLTKKKDDSVVNNNIKFSSGDEYSDYSSKDISILKRKTGIINSGSVFLKNVLISVSSISLSLI